MTMRVDSNQLIAGRCVVTQYPGHGIQAKNIPSTGESGPAALYNDAIALGALPTDEMRWQILTVPASGVFTPYESSEFTLVGASDGVHYSTYLGFINGAPYLNPETDDGEWIIAMIIGLNEYQLDADGASFSYSGGPATLTYSSAPTAYLLNAEGGLFSYSGGVASLASGRLIQAGGGVLFYSGGNVNLIYGNTLQADGGDFTYSGGNAVFTRTYLLQSAGGSFALVGGVATLNYSAAVYSKINGYTISYASSGVSAQYSDN